MQPVLVFIIGLIFGSLAAYFAQGRGRNPVAWFFVGFFFGLLGLLSLFLFPILPQVKHSTAPSAPDPFADRAWYYLTPDHTQVGPISYNELLRLREDNALSSETYVWCDAWTDWKKMREIEKMRHNRISR